MSEMIERVAKALSDSERNYLAWEDESEVYKKLHREAARVAIAAMREPTEAMLAASVEHIEVAGDREAWKGERENVAKDVWRSMIDAAAGSGGEAGTEGPSA